ncbi:hypothetical protein J1C73_31735, partial [Streptomyces laculatispora]|nr:hypothetical protein [Streptomyces laculatispora]
TGRGWGPRWGHRKTDADAADAVDTEDAAETGTDPVPGHGQASRPAPALVPVSASGSPGPSSPGPAGPDDEDGELYDFLPTDPWHAKAAGERADRPAEAGSVHSSDATS